MVAVESPVPEDSIAVIEEGLQAALVSEAAEEAGTASLQLAWAHRRRRGIPGAWTVAYQRPPSEAAASD